MMEYESDVSYESIRSLNFKFFGLMKESHDNESYHETNLYLE